jgi:hypothetical protein
MDGPYRLPFRTIPVALTGAAQLRADVISSCCYIVNLHNHPSWPTSCKEGMAWYSSRPMPSRCLWLSNIKDDMIRGIGYLTFHFRKDYLQKERKNRTEQGRSEFDKWKNMSEEQEHDKKSTLLKRTQQKMYEYCTVPSNTCDDEIQSRKLKSRYGARNRFQEPSLESSSRAT